VDLCPSVTTQALKGTKGNEGNDMDVTKMSSGQRKGEATRIDMVEANQLYAELPRPYNSF
jgi:hypothetical protein